MKKFKDVLTRALKDQDFILPSFSFMNDWYDYTASKENKQPRVHIKGQEPSFCAYNGCCDRGKISTYFFEIGGKTSGIMIEPVTDS